MQRCAKLEHAVTVVFECGLFSTKDCMWPYTESMKRRVDDGRTIHIYIYHVLRALLYRLCGARSGSPQLCTCIHQTVYTYNSLKVGSQYVAICCNMLLHHALCCIAFALTLNYRNAT